MTLSQSINLYYRNKVIRCQVAIALLLLIITTIYKPTVVIAALLGALWAIIPVLLYIGIAFGRGMVILPYIAIKRHKQAILAKYAATILVGIIIVGYCRLNSYITLFLSYIAVSFGYLISLLI